MPLRLLVLLITTLALTPLHAQFEMQNSTTAADLRGISNPGNGTAWASGTHGTVLRTEDGGYVWQRCATPPGAENLDFRGIQAFDDQTAIVMSSGKGDLSRVYKTTDGCNTWRLVFTNPDTEGFFDSLLADKNSDILYVLGDAVAGKVIVWSGADDDRESWQHAYELGDQKAIAGEGSFAASNSVLVRSLCSEQCHPERSEGSASQRAAESRQAWTHIWFASQAPGTSLTRQIANEDNGINRCEPCRTAFTTASTPMAQNTTTAGIFSLAFRDEQHGVAVGGDYSKPAGTERSAAITRDAGSHWQLATHPPHGYRSSVAYDPQSKTWITVGPNGTDISTDDGRNWRPLTPGPLDDPDADRQWNALALPYVVGPHGRIGRLRTNALARNR